MQDSRGQGPPGDIGTYLMPCEVLVFHYTFSGTQYACAVRHGSRGWVLVSYLTVDATVMQAAMNALTAARTWQETVVFQGNFVPAAALLAPNWTILSIHGKITAGLSTNGIIQPASDPYNNITIEGGVIDGARGTWNSGALYFATNNPSNLLTIRCVWIQNTNLTAVYIDNLSGGFIEDVWSNASDNMGIFLWRCSDIVARNFGASSCTNENVKLQTVYHCSFTDMGGGGSSNRNGQIYMVNSYDNVFTNTRCDYSATHGIYLYGSYDNDFVNTKITRGQAANMVAIVLDTNCFRNRFVNTDINKLNGATNWAYAIYEQVGSDYNQYHIGNIRDCTNTIGGLGNQSRVSHIVGYNPVGNIANPYSVGAGYLLDVAGAQAFPTTHTNYTVGHSEKLVTIYGGTVTQILVDGVATGLTSGAFQLKVGQVLHVDWTGQPSSQVYAQ